MANGALPLALLLLWDVNEQRFQHRAAISNPPSCFKSNAKGDLDVERRVAHKQNHIATADGGGEAGDQEAHHWVKAMEELFVSTEITRHYRLATILRMMSGIGTHGFPFVDSYIAYGLVVLLILMVHYIRFVRLCPRRRFIGEGSSVPLLLTFYWDQILRQRLAYHPNVARYSPRS